MSDLGEAWLLLVVMLVVVVVVMGGQSSGFEILLPTHVEAQRKMSDP